MNTLITNTIHIRCINCGKEFDCPTNRFPVCNCGHTISINDSDKYGEYLCDRIIVHGENEISEISLYDKEKLCYALPHLQFKDEMNIRKSLLSEIKKEQLNGFSVAEILLHKIYYRHSPVYKAIFDKGYLALAKQMLYDYNLRQFKDAMPNPTFKGLDEYLFEIHDDRRMCIALDFCLYGYSVFTATTMANYNIELNSFEYMLDNTKFDISILTKYVGELGSIMMMGSEIIKEIMEYDFYKFYLENELNKKLDERQPIYNNIHLAKTIYNIQTKNGMIAYQNYLKDFNIKTLKVKIGDYIVGEVGADEIRNYAFNTLPIDGVSKPLISATKNGKTVSTIISTNGETVIIGDTSDEIKKIFNKYFDEIERK